MNESEIIEQFRLMFYDVESESRVVDLTSMNIILTKNTEVYPYPVVLDYVRSHVHRWVNGVVKKLMDLESEGYWWNLERIISVSSVSFVSTVCTVLFDDALSVLEDYKALLSHLNMYTPWDKELKWRLWVSTYLINLVKRQPMCRENLESLDFLPSHVSLERTERDGIVIYDRGTPIGTIVDLGPEDNRSDSFFFQQSYLRPVFSIMRRDHEDEKWFQLRLGRPVILYGGEYDVGTGPLDMRQTQNMSPSFRYLLDAATHLGIPIPPRFYEKYGTEWLSPTGDRLGSVWDAHTEQWSRA